MEEDLAIANLLASVAARYRKQAQEPDGSINRTRLETIRKLELITQSIKGLMRYDQEAL